MLKKKFLIFVVASMLIGINFIQNDLANKVEYSKIDNSYNKLRKNIFSNLQENEWNKTYGGTGDEEGLSVQQTNDGGYIITGYTTSHGSGNKDIWLLKTDTNGNIIWDRTFGSIENDIAYSVQQTSDSGYIIIGTTFSTTSLYNIWLIKTDSDGILEWDNKFGKLSYSEIGYSVQQTNDGGYIISGPKQNLIFPNEVWLIKTNHNGKLEWDKTFKINSSSYSSSVQQTNDGGYIITGGSSSPGGFSYVFLLKTDNKGKKEWIKTFAGNNYARGNTVRQTNDGGYIVIAEKDTKYQNHAWLIKTDDEGNLEWDKSFNHFELLKHKSIEQTNDGGYIFIGTYSELSETSISIIKTDEYGTEKWNEIFDGEDDEAGYSVQQTNDGWFIIAGYTTSYGAGGKDIWVIKTWKLTPKKPETPIGKTYGAPGNLYEYHTSTIDPDDDQVYYWFDWGDETTSSWLGPYNSSEQITASHLWENTGIYNIRVRAKDIDGKISDWSDPLKVSMPKMRLINNLFEKHHKKYLVLLQ